jgi:hypothetical protein
MPPADSSALAIFVTLLLSHVHFDADVVPFLHVSFLSSSRSATRNVQDGPSFFVLILIVCLSRSTFSTEATR